MEITIAGQHMDIGEALKTHIEDNITDTVSKFFDHTISADVHLIKETHGLFQCDITLSVGNGIVLKVEDEEHEVYAAFDKALQKMTKRLRRYKGRLRDHHRKLIANQKETQAVLASQYVIEAEQEEPNNDNESTEHNPVIIAESQTRIEELSVGEAVMRLDLASLPAMLFRNTKSGHINMVYRRDDGHIGWMDPAQDNQASQKTATK